MPVSTPGSASAPTATGGATGDTEGAVTPIDTPVTTAAATMSDVTVAVMDFQTCLLTEELTGA
ncbi:MAG: hypothetical protein JWM51_1198 [Microbacteriaceae bacterium]|jgi:hypothetical protein|nr:hypothetical protein [Microbacteriaceae bacterium]